MLHSYSAALALAATMLAVAGCGGSSKAGSTSASASATPTATTAVGTATANTAPPPTVTVKVASGKPLTRAEWIGRGDEICGRLNAELETVKVRKTAELSRVLPQVAAYQRAAVAQLAKLVPPSAMAGDWQQYLNAVLQAAEDDAKLAESASLGDAITKAPLVATIRGLGERFARIARRDGFKECSTV